MRIFRLVVVLAVVLSLLVAASVPAYAGKDKPPDKKEKPAKVVPKKPKPPKPKDQDPSQPDPVDEPDEGAEEMVTICHKPGTPAEKTLTVPLSAWSGHKTHGDTMGACGTVAEPPADEPEADVEGKALICHKPGTPAEQTLEVAASAVEAHVAHGDYEGPCSADEPLPEPGDESEEDTEGKLLICHKPGTPAEQTLEVAASAVDAHLAHGDVLGSCDDEVELPDEPVVDPGTEPGEDTTAKVEICHQPGTPAQQTLTISASDVADHLAHGDALGPCPDTSDAAAEGEAPWVARLVAAALSIILKFQEFAASLSL